MENVISPVNEEGEKDEYLKMHDVIRDLALWLARENGKKKNKFVVKDGVGYIGAKEVENWKETQRISLLRNTDIEELREPPYFPNMETFLATYKFIQSFYKQILYKHAYYKSFGLVKQFSTYGVTCGDWRLSYLAIS